MFTIEVPATIPATLKIVGQGEEQELKLVYKGVTKDVYQAKLESLREGKASVADVLLDLVESWEASLPFDREGIAALQLNKPMADYAILLGYGDAYTVSRKGN